VPDLQTSAHPRSSLSRAVSPPAVFGVYRLIAELGSGPFGAVYRAALPGGEPPVVVRAFAGIGGPERGVALLEAFTRICEAPLDHGSIARPLTCGIEANVPYIVYAYLDGAVLRDRLTRRRSSWRSELLRSVTQVAGAIDFAAAAGVHHGALDHHDLIAGAAATGVTAFGVVDALLGAGIAAPDVAPFASPQRRSGAPPTVSDDVYSLAAIAYELVHGVPFVRGVPAPVVSGVDPERLAGVFRAALAESPDDRPCTALEFAARLQDALAPSAPMLRVPVAEAVLPAPDRHARGGRWALVAAALVIGIAIGFAGGMTTAGLGSSTGSVARGAAAPDARPALAATEIEIEPAGTSGGDVVETREVPVSQPRPAPPSSRGSAVSGWGALQIESRPAGAEVILNGRTVGSTPLVLRSVAAGRHRVQLALPGYRPWWTSVHVDANARTRIGASLER
jgi:hypothetical protein